MTTLVDSCAPWLSDRAHSVHSQYGEDGLIEAVFERIGAANGWCVEVGAGDGVTLSNTKALRDEGWRALLIEKDEVHFAQLETLALIEPATVAVFAEVDCHQFSDVLGFYGLPRDFDLCVIDIDGQDYWLWSGLHEFRPRVVMIEFSPYVCNPAFVPDVGEYGHGGRRQAGVGAMRNLAAEKGYIEVARTYVNLIFVRADLLKD